MITFVKEKNGIINATYSSSNIASSSYDTNSHTLFITFVKGDLVYKYDNVNEVDYYNLHYAESTGKAFIDSIKNKYTGEKV